MVDCLRSNPISTFFQLHIVGQCTYSCFPGVILISIPLDFLSKFFRIFEILERGEREMNPVAMTVINSLKEKLPNRGSKQRPPVLKSGMLPTELWRLDLYTSKDHSTSSFNQLSDKNGFYGCIIMWWLAWYKVSQKRINSLPNNKFLDWSKLKTVADNKFYVATI